MPWGGNGRQGSSLDSPFSRSTQDYDLPSQTAIHKGLVLTAVKRRTIGRLGSRRAVYPWRSGIVSTYRKFEFMGGYVQVEAKVPTSPGMWPAIWMLPGSSSANAGDNYEVDIFEGGYNLVHANPQDTYAWHLITPTGKVGGVVDVHRNLGDGFLVYGMRWIPKKSITWYLNGSAVAKVTQSQASIPAEPMDLILDLGVAAPGTSGFRTVPNQGTTSPSSMIVDKVQVYSSSRKSAG